ncbi:MAG: hypothetical protein MUE70_07640, partial [Desulfobacterales bacterium]|nr:hypothetical protein [Desulfobacterales bacterium]
FWIPKLLISWNVLLICFFTWIILFAYDAYAEDFLLFLEGQGVAGYSGETDDISYYSHMPEEAMQKPSVGLDFLKRFSGQYGDFGAFALQYRLAYDDYEDNMESQVYNAYFKYKAGWSDLWIGHNRPAMGISSYLDSHGLLLQPLPMNGFGFDRDWGIGTYKEFDWGNFGISVTTGSGMPIRFDGNYLASARISKGFLNQDNYNVGLSLSGGETLGVMGYEIVDHEPRNVALAGVDAAYFWNIFEARLEVMGGENREENAIAAFFRGGVNLMEEGRLKLEFQPIYTRLENNDNYQLAGGASYLLTGDITLRSMYLYDHDMDDYRVVVQIYLYKKV